MAKVSPVGLEGPYEVKIHQGMRPCENGFVFQSYKEYSNINQDVFVSDVRITVPGIFLNACFTHS